MCHPQLEKSFSQGLRVIRGIKVLAHKKKQMEIHKSACKQHYSSQQHFFSKYSKGKDLEWSLIMLIPPFHFSEGKIAFLQMMLQNVAAAALLIKKSIAENELCQFCILLYFV